MPFSGGTAGAHDDAMHQGNAKRDVADGVAGLGPAGELLAPGPDLVLTRDGLDNIELVERTSGEIVARWTRVGVNDYTQWLHVGAVPTEILNDAMKDVANGIAGLNAEKVQIGSYPNPMCDEYHNHVGAVDNFTETDTYGNATANTDVANHEMDLSTGITVPGAASFQEKTGRVFTTSPQIFEMLIQNLALGSGGSRYTFLGVADTYAGVHWAQFVSFVCLNDNSWVARSYDGVDYVSTSIAALSNGDLLTIVATTTVLKFYVNGVLVATHTTGITSNIMRIGAEVSSEASAATGARTVSVDYMSVRRYV